MNNIPVDPIALRCVETGLIDCVNVRISANGLKYSIVPGQSLVGTGPFHAFRKYDLEMSLPYLREKLSDLDAKPSGSLLQKRDSGGPELIRKPTSLVEARELFSRYDLGQIDRGGVKNLLPRDSITVHEFKRPAPLFIARLMLVAEAIGEAKAVSRITTDLSLRVSGSVTLQEWWANASSEKKWTLVSTRKVSGEAKLGKPSVVDLNLLDKCECPFQETRFEMEAFKDEDEEDSYGGVSFVSY